jgi:hypothetical protein
LSLITAFVITHQVTLNTTPDDNLIAEYYYVGYPIRTPDEKTVKHVKKVLEKHGIEFDDLVEWYPDNCP